MVDVKTHSGGSDSYRWVTLPYEGKRSGVFSDKTSIVTVELPLDLQRMESCQTILLTSLVIVLAKYSETDGLKIGICKDGIPVSLNLEYNADFSIDRLRSVIEEKVKHIDWDAPLCADVSSNTEAYGKQNSKPLIGIMVSLDTQSVPAVRQDVTLRFTRNFFEAEYSVRVFERDTVERFLSHVKRVFLLTKTSPSSKCSSICLLEGNEETDIRMISRGSCQESIKSIQSLLAGAVNNFGEQSTIEYKGDDWTLKQLVHRSEQFVLAAQKFPMTRNARLGIALSPGLDQIAALVACIRLGCTIVPIDNTLPYARQETIWTSAELTAVFTEVGFLEQDSGDNLIFIDDLRPSEHKSYRNLIVQSVDLDAPLYLMFTSGSTGIPKGVLVPHKTLSNLICHEENRKSAVGRRTLGRTSIAFDVGIQEVLSTILFGGTLVIADDEERADVGSLCSLLKDQRISRTYLPPVALYQMVESNDAVALDLEEVIVAGEQLRISQSIKRFFRNTSARLINQYGPTETHVVTEEKLGDATLRWPELPSVGKPIQNVDTFVVDPYGNLVPRLVPGEILVGGYAPGLGYINEQESHEAFINSNFYSNSEERLYRTGDKARWLSDGSLEFLGRLDDQVKIRGYRVELGDLEANAQSLPDVKMAASKYWETEEWSGLSLYFVLNDFGRASVRELRESLRKKVPDYMVPPLGAMMILQEMPVSNTGKIARSKLPFPGLADPALEANSSIEDRIATIWRRRIGIGNVGPEDDFLDIGGHSLVAIQIISEINDTFEVAVPLSSLLRGISLCNFVKLVKDHVSMKVESDAAQSKSKDLPKVIETNSVESGESGEIKLPIGKLSVISVAEARQSWIEVFEEKAYMYPNFIIPKSATIIDVGANIGLFSRFALSIAPKCRLISIEPSLELFNCLTKNLREYSDQVDLLNLGCSDENSDASSFWYFPHVPSMSSFSPALDSDRLLLAALLSNQNFHAVTNGEKWLDSAFEASLLQVERRKLSVIIEGFQLDNVDLLKIDVQRGEDLVLKGITRADYGKIRQIVVELQDEDSRMENVTEILIREGYNVDSGSISIHSGTKVRYVYGLRN